MSQLEHGCAIPATPTQTPTLSRGTRGLIRWVCTNNPFYVLSALLVLVGLWVSFGAQVRAEQTWALMSGMAAYTLLLAVPACLLVRFGGVWEDVRTVLLLVVLMFLATSVTFDETLARSPGLGIACYLGGFAVRRRGQRGDAPGDAPGPARLVPRAVLPVPGVVLPLPARPRPACSTGRGARRSSGPCSGSRRRPGWSR